MPSEDPEILFKQGVFHTAHGDYASAELNFRKALELAPGSLPALLNLGFVLDMQGRTDEALGCYEAVLAISPENPKARYNRASHLLRTGNLLEGFADYEARFSAMQDADNRVYSQPRWDGAPLNGRSILVYCEQGLGDAIQFGRYIPLLAKQGGRVVLETQEPLASLLSSIGGVDKVVLKSESPPETDCYIQIPSLPHMFRTTLDSIPGGIPYVMPPEQLVSAWQTRVDHDDDKIRVGLVWAGKERPYPNRSCPPEYLLPLLAMPGTRFYSLQIGEGRFPLPPEFTDRFIDLTPWIKDFADTAALITNLDLVITIDTAVAHLAGALGKTVWVMLPYDSDWRWMLNRDDSPWYPTMRLFRQPHPGDWESVICNICHVLQGPLSHKADWETTSSAIYDDKFQGALASLENNDPDAAIPVLRNLLAALPDEPAVWFNLGRAYEMKGLFKETVQCYRQALLQSPNNAAVWLRLGENYLKQKAYSEAESHLRRAYELMPEACDILLDLGAALVQQGKNDEAFECCRKVLGVRPESPTARFYLSYLQLRNGEYLDGFANFEARLAIKRFDVDKRCYPQPRWDGSPLNGQTILVFGEQGMGDVIQFARYLPMVAERGGKVFLEIDAPLIPLFSSFPGVARVVPKSETPPLTDVYVHLLSLPYLFGTTLETVPGCIPYIVPEQDKSVQWRQILADESVYRIGLVWRGNPQNPTDRERSCPLASFLPLASFPGVRFFSLQVGEGTDEIASLAASMELVDYTDRLKDFTDTAALIAHLDLVIGVDTAVTHLAGAMGKPVWVMLPHVYDWRWLIGRNDSPWYPSARVFWQQQADDWGGVMERVKEALALQLGGSGRANGLVDIESCYYLGARLMEEGDLPGAERCFREIVELDPDLPDPQHSLGVVLQLQGRPHEAIEHYRIAIARDPGFVKAHYNLANALLLGGLHQEALASARTTLQFDPEHADAHRLLGMLLLQSGDFRNGWKEYEWRWRAKGFKERFPDLGCPQWDGSPLDGKTLLIHMEQGRGDMIQFVRYAPLAAAKGGRVVICVTKELVPLLATVEGISQVVDRNKPLPRYDLHVPALSLPYVLGTTLETIPAQVPYIRPDSARVEAWREIMPVDGRFRVGLVWQGSPAHRDDHNRSATLTTFEPLGELKGLVFYSLQLGSGSEQLLESSAHLPIIDLTDRIHDFSDTAALLANLDLVISVDTAVAHLAGALGKPVWVLLPFVPDWRWMLDREDSPWYPTMRFFRQSSPGNWQGVVARVQQELPGLLKDAATVTQWGIEQLKSGHAAEAERAFAIAVTLNQDNAEAHCNLGVAMDAQRRHEEAIACYRAAFSCQPDYFQALFNMGNAYMSLGKQGEARACYEQSVELAPDFLPAYLCLGELGKKRREFGRAHKSYALALAIDPYCADALQGRAETYQAEEQFEQAITAYRQALDLEPGRANVWNLLGTVFQSLERLEEAESCYRKALVLKPDREIILNNLGVVLNAQGRLAEAIAVYRRLLEVDNTYAEGHWNLSVALLALGEYLEGWREYEWRFRKTNPVADRGFVQPRWDGSPLYGKTILLHAEQGFGDTLQFVRYAPLVAQRGGKVIVECQVPALKRLLSTLEGVAEVVVAGEPLPGFDCHLPLLSLPLVFGTTLETIPGRIPYLVAEPADIEGWRNRLGEAGAFRVGLVWFGRQGQVLNRKRSCPLELFTLLANVPNIEFYSLQIGDGAEQLRASNISFPVIDLTEHVHDFADTAAFLANLDLVITIDTAVAHLAGAVGVRTWVMLPFGADWRWLCNQEGSPWYPTMRLFRQPAVGDWSSVMICLAAALNKVRDGQGFNGLNVPPPFSSHALPKQVVLHPGQGLQGGEFLAVKSPPALRVGLAWSGRQDNPLNRKRSCQYSDLISLLKVPNVIFFSLQLREPGEGVIDEPSLIDLTEYICDFEDTAALMTNLDLIISIDTAVAHLAGALGRPTWVLLPHVPDWRWLRDQEATPWYPGMRLFRQPDFGDWGSVIREVTHQLSQLSGNQPGSKTMDMLPGPRSKASIERTELEQVLKRHRLAASRNPSNPDAHLDVGTALTLLGLFEEAVSSFRKVIELAPDHVTGHMNLAYSLLMLKDYTEGFHHYEWRLRKIPHGQLPPWTMLRREEIGLHRKGTSLLVHCEQGYGDTIQFSRFLPTLADAGYRVILSCQPHLVSLAGSLRGIDQVVPHGELLPRSDLQTLLLSVPYLLSLTLETLPAVVPYLAPHPQRVESWRARVNRLLCRE